MAARKNKDFVYSENEVRNMDIEFVPPPEKPRQVSGTIRLISWSMLAFLALSDFYSGQNGDDAVGLVIARYAIMAAFAAVFAWLCARMAVKINRNPDFAWTLGFLFGFIGFATYWIYFRVVRAKEGKKPAKAKKLKNNMNNKANGDNKKDKREDNKRDNKDKKNQKK